MRNPETHYRPDPAFARKYASEAAIATDVQVSTFADPKPLESPEVTDPRQKAVLDKLQVGYEAATSTEGFKAYLDVVANLYNYSPRNLMLIFSQRPDATMVNSYDRWQESGRQVRKGEKGMSIFYPKFRYYDVEDPQTGLIERQRYLSDYGIGSVFDISQTDGPDISKPEPSDAFNSTEHRHELDKKASLVGIGKGIVFEKKPTPGDARGCFSPMENKIILSDKLPDDDGKLKTLLHELVHAETHGKVGYQGRSLHELTAEGSAYALCQLLGIDTSMYSFDYMAHHTLNPDMMKLVMPEIASVTKRLYGEITQEKVEEAELWL